MTGFGVLSLVTFFPIVGALLIAAQNKDATRNIRWIALYTTLITFGISLCIINNLLCMTSSLGRASAQGPYPSRRPIRKRCLNCLNPLFGLFLGLLLGLSRHRLIHPARRRL